MSRPLARWQALTLGSIVLAALAIGAWGLFQIDSRRGLDGSAFSVSAGFADIGGVAVGTRVRVQGIDAGEVEAIVPPAAPGDKVRVRMRIAGKLRHLVGQDAKVEIASENLLHGKIVRILPGSSQAAPVADGAELTALAATELSDSVAQATAKLHSILAELDCTLGEIRTGQGSAGAVAKDLAQAAGRLNTVLAKVDFTLDGVQKGEGTLGQLVKNDGLYKELSETLGQMKGALVEIRSGEGTLGKLVKNNEVYSEALQSIQDMRRMVASVKQNSDAIKSLPVVRSYVVDPHKELVRPDCKRYRKWFAEETMFEPGQAILSERGKKALDEVSAWVNGEKESNQEVVIASFVGPQHDPDYARTLTQKQSEAVLEYLKSNHRIHRTGFWFWSNRSVRAIGVGNTPVAVPETEKLPAARVELIVFIPAG
ncbi:MAG: MlaD family protein [Gemmataceae bacterium]|nr:MlaD family protein [Gemmataceae bacterium]MCI0737645.1 MlaD family protein [Gemmataceae bacterium]